jgi:hypothetical protein
MNVFMPAGDIEGWLRSDCCCLLQLAGSGLVKVSVLRASCHNTTSADH